MTTSATAGSAPAGNDTRELILVTAERLYAEHGIFAVSNRQVSEAAGQRNISAVGYHVGTKNDLVRAIIDKHQISVERYRKQILDTIAGSTDVREWITVLVQPSIEYMASMGANSSYARFSAQVMTDPILRDAVYESALSSPTLQKTLQGLSACVSSLPLRVRRTRSEMGRHLMVHMSAEREKIVSDGDVDAATSWQEFTADLIDALVGLWLAPVSATQNLSPVRHGIS